VASPLRESESMRKCMITDVVYSKIMNGLNNYEKNTGQRHPIQPDVVSTGSKRAVGKDPLTDHFDNLWYGMLVTHSYRLCLKLCFDRPYLGGDARGE
jgi:hypothetical protein